VLDVLEVVHEVAHGAWLVVSVSMDRVDMSVKWGCIGKHTGQVPLLIMLSNDNASGIPALLPELPELCDSGLG